jgi:hypothetical protein
LVVGVGASGVIGGIGKRRQGMGNHHPGTLRCRSNSGDRVRVSIAM